MLQVDISRRITRSLSTKEADIPAASLSAGTDEQDSGNRDFGNISQQDGDCSIVQQDADDGTCLGRSRRDVLGRRALEGSDAGA